VVRDNWHAHPWLADLDAGESLSDGLIDDEYDERPPG
jgi:hypothetical protein